MVTTVRVEDDAKREIDRLQGRVQAETGERLTHSELLTRLLRFARRREADFLRDASAGWAPPTAEEMDRLFSRVEDWGVDTDVTTIDDALYGGDAS